jgi:AbiJ N-terminal domain 4
MTKTFSERMGLVVRSEALQLNAMDSALRARLYNHYSECGPVLVTREPGTLSECHTRFAIALWDGFFKRSINELRTARMPEAVHDLSMDGEWPRVYDFIEFAYEHTENHRRKDFDQRIGRVLAEEMSGYRFVSGRFIPITDATELATIQSGLQHGNAAVRDHLGTALSHLSNRASPDYANSIKESIPAVEAMARVLTGDESATLGDALNTLGRKEVIHPALVAAYKKIYGFSSDEGGIRHAHKGAEPDSELAKYMLVSCTAFVHYLTELQATSCEQ